METIQFLYSLIGTPLGYILYFIYNFICENVGIAILLFTFVIKLAMLPLAIKQQKNTAKSAIFAPKVKEIQTKYKNNQEKQQEELQKLQQQGYNPMGGCGSMLLTFLILFGVLDVVYKPMTHIIHTSKEKTESMVQEAHDVELAAIFVNEVTLSAEDAAKLKTEALEKHNGIVRDAEKILAYYNENCLAAGDE
ncbi:MAG: membrane protein insertase YidC, partial [Oscillospiraceae bacterium]|nr:membrane protein insertase YidC [Oscillospiraceae bacterium]